MPDTLVLNQAAAPGEPRNGVGQQHQLKPVLVHSNDNLVTESTRFIYEDSSHFSFLLDKLNTLRKSKQFCDVILQVGSHQDVHEIYAHRAVLAAASSYFLDLFSNDLKTTPCGIPQIQLYTLLSGNYDVEAFEYLIDYIYTSRIEIRKEKVKAIYALANRLKMPALAYECGQFLASTLTPDSCLLVRSIPGVLADPILLNAVDNYIRSHIEQVANCKSMEGLPKIKIEVLHKNRDERTASNEKLFLGLVVDWIRKSFDSNTTMDTLTEKVFMLYLNKSDKTLHDCNDVQNGDSIYSDVIQDYKRMSRKLSFPSKSNLPNGSLENGKHEVTLNGNGVQTNAVCSASKPRPLIFTRSDSDSSLSSIADDDESDWKILATHQPKESKNTILGLVMVAGKLCVLTVKSRLNDHNRLESTDSEETLDGSSPKHDYMITIPQMASARCAAGTACLQDKLFVCGGYDRGECSKITELYDPHTNKWIELASMKKARGRFDIAVVNDKVYAVGGSDGHKELDSAEMYNPSVNSWKLLPNCPIARSNAGVCGLDGKVYVIGGWNGERGLRRCDVYDPVSQLWEQVGPLLAGRYQAGVAVLNGYIYAVGGCDSWTCLNTVEKYDPETDSWKAIAPLTNARRGCGVTVFKEKLYVIGGHDGSRSLHSIEIYDPDTNTWSLGPSLNASRANVGVAVVYDRLYACGGFTGKTFLNSVEFLEENGSEWKTYVNISNANSDSSLSEMHDDDIQHSLSKCSLLSDEPLVEVEEERQEKTSDNNSENEQSIIN